MGDDQTNRDDMLTTDPLSGYLAYDRKSTQNAIEKALSDREALRSMLEQLIEHDAASGRSDARVWRRARALYRATARRP